MSDYELLSRWYQIVGNPQPLMASYSAWVFGRQGTAELIRAATLWLCLRAGRLKGVGLAVKGDG